MLRKNIQTTRRAGGRFAIVASKYNERYVNSMLNAAKAVLKKAGAAQIKVVRVPGAYEIPLVAAKLARAEIRYGAIICLGVVIRGETEHARLISEAVTSALTQIQMTTEIPIVHEVLLLENDDQARVRCLDKNHNRGGEAAQTAVDMAALLRELD
jgi:6,7-dimethyl-8-ribityllumazine synthase